MTWAYVAMTAAILLVPVGAEPWAVLSGGSHLAGWLAERTGSFATAFLVAAGAAL